MPDQVYPAEFLGDSLEAHVARHSRTGQGVYLACLALVIGALAALPLVKVRVTIRGLGILRPQTEKQAIRALVAGIVTEVLVRDNQTVEKGDPIVRLRSVALDDRASLLARQGQEKQRLAADLTRLLGVPAESLAARDLSLETPDYRREYSQFATELRENRLARERAQRELERTRALYEHQIAPASGLDDKQFDLAQLTTQGALITDRYRTRWQVALSALRAELRDLGSQQTQLAEDRASYTITAPESGTVEQVASLSPGGTVQAGELVVLLSPRSDLVAQVYVTPRDVGLVRPGTPVRITIDAFAYPDWGFIDGSVTDVSGDFVLVEGQPMFKVTCALARTRLSLRNGFASEVRKGMTLQARFQLAERSLFQLVRDDLADWLDPARAPRAPAQEPAS